MELRHLRYFRAVAEELHFGRAAARLHIAQPPLSQQIRALEQELGVTLLVRSTRRVELTEAGQLYLQRVIAILNAVDDAGRQAARVDAGLQGRLVIGCVGSVTYSVLPQLVRALSEALPHVEVSVRGEMLAPAQLSAVADGGVDIGLLRPPVHTTDLNTEVLRQDRLLVAVPAGHRLAGCDAVSIEDLRGVDLIAHVGQGRSVMGAALGELCAQAGFTPKIRHEVAETSTLVTLVAAGLGAAIVPAPTAELSVAGVDYVPLTPHRSVDLVAAWRPDGSATVARALPVLREVISTVPNP